VTEVRIQEWFHILEPRWGPLITLEKEGHYFNQSRKKCANVGVKGISKTAERLDVKEVSLSNLKAIQELENKELRMESKLELISPTLIKSCVKTIDEGVLEEGKEEGATLEIVGKAQNRSWLVKLESGAVYKSTPFLTDLLKTKEDKFKVIIGPRTTHPIVKRTYVKFYTT
jgi:hypothetical protein